MSERRRLRAAALFLFLGILALVFGGCTVTTNVSLSEQSPGHGTVAVSVRLDSAALSSVGGLSALRSDLSVQDLVAAGWSVSGPSASSAGGGAVVRVEHGYSSSTEAGHLVSDIAGNKVFGLSLSSHRSFWHTAYRLSGRVDLTCGLNCFGDSGLQSATGSPLGVQPGPLSSSTGAAPASVFRFSVDAQLPGGARPAGPAGSSGVASGGGVTWSPQLGQAVTLGATSSTLNTGAVMGVAGAGAGVLLVAVAALGWLLFRRRRRGRGASESESASASAEVVTPPS